MGLLMPPGWPGSPASPSTPAPPPSQFLMFLSLKLSLINIIIELSNKSLIKCMGWKVELEHYMEL